MDVDAPFAAHRGAQPVGVLLRLFVLVLTMGDLNSGLPPFDLGWVLMQLLGRVAHGASTGQSLQSPLRAALRGAAHCREKVKLSNNALARVPACRNYSILRR